MWCGVVWRIQSSDSADASIQRPSLAVPTGETFEMAPPSRSARDFARFRYARLVGILVGGCSGLASGQPDTGAGAGTLDETLAGQRGFDKLKDFVAELGSDDAGTEQPLLRLIQQSKPELSAREGYFLVLPPADAAFNELGDAKLASFAADPSRLANLLFGHVIDCGTTQCPKGEELFDGQQLLTLAETTLVVQKQGDGTVGLVDESGQVAVVGAEIESLNGRVMALDAVLLPSCVRGVPGSESLAQVLEFDCDHEFGTLRAVLEKTGLDTALAGIDGTGYYTVFAPTDSAFDKVDPELLAELLAEDPPTQLANILKYHVAAGRLTTSDLDGVNSIDTLLGKPLTVSTKQQPGQAVEYAFVDNSQQVVADVLGADIVAKNGVIHVIDDVMIPELSVFEAVAARPGRSILAGALERFKLDVPLATSGPYTLFVPGNGAFPAILPAEEQLATIVRYHLYAGRYDYASLKELADSQGSIESVAGIPLEFSRGSDGAVVATTCCFDEADPSWEPVTLTIEEPPNRKVIEAANGQVYLISKLLVPGVAAPVSAGTPNGQCDNAGDKLVLSQQRALLQQTMQNDIAQLLDCEDGVFACGVRKLLRLNFLGGCSCDAVELLLEPKECEYNAVLFPPGVTFDRDCLSDNLAPSLATVSGLTEGCARCFSGIAGCSAESCEDECLENGGVGVKTNDPACLKCTNAKCWPTVVECAGVPETYLPAKGELQTNNPTIYDVLKTGIPGPNSYTTLVSLIDQAGLAGALSAKDVKLTVFAPTNAAFAKLSNETIESLTSPGNAELLKRVLLYHVAPDLLPSSSLSNGYVIDTMAEGLQLTVLNQVVAGLGLGFVDNGGKQVAAIELQNIVADNGIIHAIDAVQIPATTILDYLKAKEQFSLLVSLQNVDPSLFDALKQPDVPLTVFAPTNAALTAALELIGLNAPQEELRRVLEYHIVEGGYPKHKLFGGLKLEASIGESITVRTTKSKSTPFRLVSSGKLDGTSLAPATGQDDAFTARVLERGVPRELANGYVYAIDAVLVPAPESDDPDDSDSTSVAIGSCAATRDVQALLRGSHLIGPNMKADDKALFPGGLASECGKCFDQFSACVNKKCIGRRDCQKTFLFFFKESATTQKECYDCVSSKCWQDLRTCAGDVPSYAIPETPVWREQDDDDVCTGNNGKAKASECGLVGEWQPILAVVAGDRDLSALAEQVTDEGIKAVLNGAGDYTLLAPVNSAVGDATLDVTTLKRHVLKGRFDFDALLAMNGKLVQNVLDEPVTVMANGLGVAFKTSSGLVAHSVVSNIPTSNGFVYKVRDVLSAGTTLLDVLASDGEVSLAIEAVYATGLEPVLSSKGTSLTLFLPTNDAFGKLGAAGEKPWLADLNRLKEILAFHLVSGQKIMAADIDARETIVETQGGRLYVKNDGGDVKVARVAFVDVADATSDMSTVVAADIVASNGVAHKIDTVLIPPARTVADVLAQRSDFTSLAGLVGQAGLTAALRSPGPWTVFAPTNAAIAAFQANQPEFFAKVAADQALLTSMLLYHVRNGSAVLAESMQDGLIPTLNGGMMYVSVDSNTVQVRSTKRGGTAATVVMADLTADNGVIHGIDMVLVPPARTIVDYVAEVSMFSTLLQAVTAAGLDTVLDGLLGANDVLLAPTDSAFDDFYAPWLNKLLQPAQQSVLVDVLKFHVCKGCAPILKRMASSTGTVAGGTLLGSAKLYFKLNAGGQVLMAYSAIGFEAEGSTVLDINAAYTATNGLVLPIDKVLVSSVGVLAVLDDRFSMLLQAAQAADLAEILFEANKSVAVFAPQNTVFQDTFGRSWDALLENKAKVTELIKMHVHVESDPSSPQPVVAGTLSRNLNEATRIETQGGALYARWGPGWVNGWGLSYKEEAGWGQRVSQTLNVNQGLQIAGNGAIYTVNELLRPMLADLIGMRPGLNELSKALEAAGLTGALQDPEAEYTVFAPNDAAFKKVPPVQMEILKSNITLLTTVLLSHVVKGTVMANSLPDLVNERIETLGTPFWVVEISKGKYGLSRSPGGTVDASFPFGGFDITGAHNGLIHVIDSVLLPADIPTTGNLVQVVAANPTLSQLAYWLGQDDELITTLRSAGPFTVFAPTDTAFETFKNSEPAPDLTDRTLLRRLLLNHVIIGAATKADSLEADQKLKTGAGVVYVNTEKTGLSMSKGGGTEASFLTNDIEASNGVAHVINAVLVPPESTLADIISHTPDLSTLADLVKTAGLIDILDSVDTATVFAPTNDAFNDDTVAALKADPATLKSILMMHVNVGPAVRSDDVENQKVVYDSTYGPVYGHNFNIFFFNTGLLLSFSPTDPNLRQSLDLPTFVDTDIEATNGVVHTLNTVLNPPLSGVLGRKDSQFATLTAALKAADLFDVFSANEYTNAGDDLTLFAPTDAAFFKLGQDTLDALLTPAMKLKLQAILSKHLVIGAVVASGALFDGMKIETDAEVLYVHKEKDGWVLSYTNQTNYRVAAKIMATDISGAHGIIHEIDSVLIGPTLLELAARDPNLSSLSTYLPLVADDLANLGTMATVFAPTNEAFNKVVSIDETLDVNDDTAVRTVLLNHVAVGELMAAVILGVKDGVVTTAAGSNLYFKQEGGAVLISNTKDGETMAKVIQRDLIGSEGIVHVIDGVLIPTPPAQTTTVATTTPLPSLAELLTRPSPAGNKFTKLLDLLSRDLGGGMLSELVASKSARLTVFAPTDKAFAKAMPDITDMKLLDPENKDKLKAVLLFHVMVGEALASGDLVSGQEIKTQSGSLFVVTDGDNIGLALEKGGKMAAKFLEVDVAGSNGYAHVIDAVLVPPGLSKMYSALQLVEQNFAELYNLVSSSETTLNLIQSSTEITILAPVDAAILTSSGIGDSKRLNEVLMGHIVEGQTLDLNTLQEGDAIQTKSAVLYVVKTGDNVGLAFEKGGVSKAIASAPIYEGYNGNVITINAVLVPPQRTILDVIQSNQRLDTLSSAIAKSQLSILSTTLDSKKATVTLLAPTNSAFRRAGVTTSDLGSTFVDDILDYHIAVGAALQSVAVKDAAAKGKTLSFGLKGDKKIFVSGNNVVGYSVSTSKDGPKARISTADLEGANGFVHMIESVLLPPATNAPTMAPTPTTEPAPTTPAPLQTIAELMTADGDLKNFLRMLSDAKMSADLTGGTVTVFAPTNQAIETFQSGPGKKLLADPQELMRIVQFHIKTDGVIRYDQLRSGKSIPMMLKDDEVKVLGGAFSGFRLTNSDRTAGEAKILGKQSFTASDGELFKISKVLLPIPKAVGTVPTVTTTDATTTTTTRTTVARTTTGLPVWSDIMADLGLTQLADLIKLAGLESQLTVGGLTILAPTDEAFYNLRAEIGDEIFDRVTNDRRLAKQVVQLHVIVGRFSSNYLSTAEQEQSMLVVDGSPIQLAFTGSESFKSLKVTAVGSKRKPSRIKKTNVLSAKSVVHTVNRVLIPELPDFIITNAPTTEPTAGRTVAPTDAPTQRPTLFPSQESTKEPTMTPTKQPSSAVTAPPPTPGSTSASSAENSSSEDESDDGMMLIVIILVVAVALICIVVLVAVVIVRSKPNKAGSPTRADGIVSFSNPVYDSAKGGSVQRPGPNQSQHAGYVPPSYVQPEPTANPGYMDVNPTLNAGYMDVNPGNEYDDSSV